MSNELREFWSRVAEKYDRVVDLQIGPRTRSLVRQRLLAESALGKLVEFGCGTGFYTEALTRKADTVVATDMSPGMLDVARDRIKQPNVTFRVEDCQKISFGDAVFDTAFMSLLLHFTDAVKTLAEMHRVLKPGGQLIVANLDPTSLSGLDRVRCLLRVVLVGLGGYRTNPPKGFGRNILSEQKLRGLLHKAGFETLSVETFKDPSRSSNIPVEYFRAVRV
jgi:ubiquinone/menaquinone biosynthesis C-methylase UbiE